MCNGSLCKVNPSFCHKTIVGSCLISNTSVTYSKMMMHYFSHIATKIMGNTVAYHFYYAHIIIMKLYDNTVMELT
jgi:hypothetical protein